MISTGSEGSDTKPGETDTDSQGSDTKSEETDTDSQGSDTKSEETDTDSQGSDTKPEGTDTEVPDPNGISYVEKIWNGTGVVSVTKTAEAKDVPADGSMTDGWYYLNSNVTKKSRISSITGDVNLILGDGSTLDVRGLYVPAGSTLTIYGQSEGTGKIYSHPTGGGAAIGGYSKHDNGNVVIHGGTIEAIGDDHCAGIGSNDGRTGGDITIYGGTITAQGGSDGAAIGGGRKCSGGTITIYVGDITANGPTDKNTSENGAGIGGGCDGAPGTVIIMEAV